MGTPKVTVVGLGPGDERFVTASTLTVIDSIERRFLRTARHPCAHLVGEATSFDDRYETARDFETLYRDLVEELVAAAYESGEILYAVPGSPLVLERTVALLRREDRVECLIHPAMSFLDLAYDRLGIDPVEAGLQLVDALQFTTQAAGHRGPLLVAHTHAQWVLSEMKLAIDDPDTGTDGSADEVALLQRLGTDDESITWVRWDDLDRTVTADHLTTVYIPHLATPVGSEYIRFHQLARTLRERCPWDIEQTHDSLVRHLIEETYELVDAIAELDAEDPSTDDHFIEELGDLLYQIEFHATIAEQQGRFTIADVTRSIHDKLVRRHPHVFATTDTEVNDAADVARQWERIKAAERADEAPATSVLDGVARSLPALATARELGAKAARAGFDWPDVRGPIDKVAEELDELRAEIDTAHDEITGRERRTDELGDVLFAVANTARHLGIDAELALRRANQRFRQRFEYVERCADEDGIDLRSCDPATLEDYWERAKTALAPRSDID